MQIGLRMQFIYEAFSKSAKILPLKENLSGQFISFYKAKMVKMRKNICNMEPCKDSPST